MRKIIFTIAMLSILAAPAFAQQDPDDPGMQDSLIFWCPNDHVDSLNSYQFRFLNIYAVTDDSVMYVHLPLELNAPGGGIIVANVEFLPPFNCDDGYDTVIVNQGCISTMGIADGSVECPPLFTDSLRQLIAIARIIIAPNTPSQLVVFDTCYDDRNGSVAFSDELGEIEITPAIQRAYLSIGSVGIGTYEPIPDALSISQNYPNPFNAATTIEFSLPSELNVELVIYDILGRNVRTLVSGRLEAGAHDVTWDSVDNTGEGTPSGVYFYILRAGDQVMTKKMILIK